MLVNLFGNFMFAFKLTGPLRKKTVRRMQLIQNRLKFNRFAVELLSFKSRISDAYTIYSLSSLLAGITLLKKRVHQLFCLLEPQASLSSELTTREHAKMEGKSPVRSVPELYKEDL
jgi:hypothetical protein